MSILVTGATGFVGSHVARQLAAEGGSVRVLVRPSSNLAALEGLGVEPVTGDLRDEGSLDRMTRGVRWVFHVAADYRLWARNPADIYESNVEGTRKLFAAARRNGVERVVYTSTVATIAVPLAGGDREALPNENTRSTLDQMIGHYKRSKFLAEQVAFEAAADGIPVVIVNPTAPVGPNDWKPTPTGKIIVDFLNGKMPAYVDTGLNVAAVEDVAAGHLLAAKNGRVGQRYILGGRNMTLREILGALAKITGRSAPRIRIPHAVALAAAYGDAIFARLSGREPQIPVEGVKMSRHRMFVASDKAEKELGYHAGPVEPALARAVEWYESRGYDRGRTSARPEPRPAAA
jgi:dihydroflavonol-4-reductase